MLGPWVAVGRNVAFPRARPTAARRIYITRPRLREASGRTASGFYIDASANPFVEVVADAVLGWMARADVYVENPKAFQVAEGTLQDYILAILGIGQHPMSGLLHLLR